MSQNGSGPNYRPTEGGLPEAADYNPDAVGTADIEAGEPDQMFRKYGIETVPVLLNGEDSGRRFLLRNGEYIADVSDGYKLLPNERVVEVANQVARDLGAEPFHEFDGDWYVTLDDHVYQDKERRRVHALYAWESGTIADDEMEYGFAVHNSIDTSLAFKVSLFSFRHACANMVNIGVGNSRDRMAQGVEDEREVLENVSVKHTQTLDIDRDALGSLIKTTVGFIPDIHDTYESWLGEDLNPRQIEDLYQRFPNKNLPSWVVEVGERLEAEAENEDLSSFTDLAPANRADIVRASQPEAQTVWSTYNDLTENIWHDESTKDTSKRAKFDSLHRVFNPLATVGDS